MRPSHNANEFIDNFRRILRLYDRRVERDLTELRQKLAGKGHKRPDSPPEHLLEAQVRTFLIDGFLAALNWWLRSETENVYGLLINEQPIRTSDEASIRYLDYLGLDSKETKPLFVIESKRPGYPLPQTSSPHGDSLPNVIKQGLINPEILKGEWEQWVMDLKDYVSGVFNRCGQWPRRVVISNGEWIIIFKDPENAFSGSEEVISESIVVFQDIRNLNNIGAEIFQLLSYQNVLDRIEPLTPPQLSFFVPKEQIRCFMHGVKVTLGSKEGQFKIEPTIYVLPMILLQTKTDGWLRIQRTEYEREIPHRYRDLRSHIASVQTDANRLKDSLQNICGTVVELKSLHEHYSNYETFGLRKGVTYGTSDRIELEILTGIYTHFIRERPLLSGCPYHNWESCDCEQVAAEGSPVRQRSVNSKSFFTSGEKHHCSHQTTLQIKREQLTEVNLGIIGPRSGVIGSAFCEIYSLDHYLCCQVCVFYEVCSQSSVFNLPCCHRTNIHFVLGRFSRKLLSCCQRLLSRIFTRTWSKRS